MKKIKLLLVVSILSAIGCGIKGDPLPPAESETVQKADQTGTKVNPATNSSQTENKKKKTNQ